MEGYKRNNRMTVAIMWPETNRSAICFTWSHFLSRDCLFLGRKNLFWQPAHHHHHHHPGKIAWWWVSEREPRPSPCTGKSSPASRRKYFQANRCANWKRRSRSRENRFNPLVTGTVKTKRENIWALGFREFFLRMRCLWREGLKDPPGSLKPSDCAGLLQTA